MHVLVVLLPLLVGVVLDAVLGDPSWLPHPIVGFGRLIARAESLFNKGSCRKTKGALTAVILIVATYAVFFFLIRFCYACNLWLGVAVSAVFVFYFLAGTTLIREVLMVFKALDHSLEHGRIQVARIVGRDTTNLDAQEVRTAALETLAENLSDGVIAPLFWFMLLGVPGMAAYKMINTLDSMIGYTTARYKDFGCWAAHIDDAANYIPARLTALLMVLPYAIFNFDFVQNALARHSYASISLLSLNRIFRLSTFNFQLSIFNFIWRYGRNHASPNSGYPESALAGILNCRFGGTHTYFGEECYKPFIGDNPRELTTHDALQAVRVNIMSEVIMVVLVAVVRLLC